MYFLRRRHGRKTHPEARRETPQPPAAVRDEVPANREEMSEAELENLGPPRPTVITKVRRPQSAAPADDDCKPAGTFRAGTLHIDRSAQSQERHGKI